MEPAELQSLLAAIGNKDHAPSAAQHAFKRIYQHYISRVRRAIEPALRHELRQNRRASEKTVGFVIDTLHAHPDREHLVLGVLDEAFWVLWKPTNPFDPSGSAALTTWLAAIAARRLADKLHDDIKHRAREVQTLTGDMPEGVDSGHGEAMLHSNPLATLEDGALFDSLEIRTLQMDSSKKITDAIWQKQIRAIREDCARQHLADQSKHHKYEIFQLRMLGKQPDEVASEIGLSLGAVKSHFNQAVLIVMNCMKLRLGINKEDRGMAP